MADALENSTPSIQDFGDVVVTPKATYFAQYVRDDRNPSESTPQKKSATNRWYKWGDDDDAPNDIYKTAYNNDLMPVIIERKASLISGLGVSLYTKKIDEKGKIIKEPVDLEKEPLIQDFFEENEIDLYLHKRALHLETFANAFTSFYLGNGGAYKNKIVRMVAESVQNVRCGFYEDYTSTKNGMLNLVKEFYLSGDFKKSRITQKEGVDDSNTSTSDFIAVNSAELDFKDAFKKGRSILHTRYPQSGQDYYSYPNWYFGLGGWIDLAAKISTFQNANIDNAMYAKQLVVIPQSLIESQAKSKNIDDLKAARLKIIQDIEDQLAGGKNAGKTLCVVEYNNMGQRDKVTLQKIENNNNDTLFLQSYDLCTRAISRAMGLSPILAGLHLDGSQGSGSEIKYLYNYEVQVAAPKRRLLLRDLEFVKKVNGWPKNIHFEIENAKMIDTADNKSGFTTTTKENAVQVNQ